MTASPATSEVKGREERLLAERPAQEGGFQHDGRFLKSAALLMKPQKQARESVRITLSVVSSRVERKRRNYFSFESNPRLNNRNASHSSVRRETEYSLDDLGGKWASEELKEEKVSLWLVGVQKVLVEGFSIAGKQSG